MDKICRICLEGGVLSSIFTKNFSISLSDMIEYCCNVKISIDDGLPEVMCSNCVYKLGIAYHFKQTCENADIRQRQHLGLRALSKYNDVAIMTDPVVFTHTTIVKKCKCKISEPKRSCSNYKKKSDSEKLKRGPKPKPKTVHSCSQCDKEFRCQAQLEMHVRTHTGDKPFACPHCPRRFSQKHNLTIHMRIHTGEKPFQCKVCSKKFSAQGNLHAHMKIHTGQRDHVCSLCNKSFVTSSELTRHINKHRGVKNFKCDACPAAYVNSRDLKTHKLKKHQIAPNKSQTEGYNSSGNIDIIGLDGKDPPVQTQTKEVPTYPSHMKEAASFQQSQMKDPVYQPDPIKLASYPSSQIKEVYPPQMKESCHLIPHLISEKPHLPIVPEPTMIPYEHRSVKDIFHQSHSCAICGQEFAFLTGLAQHYSLRHKGYEHLNKSSSNT